MPCINNRNEKLVKTCFWFLWRLKQRITVNKQSSTCGLLVYRPTQLLSFLLFWFFYIRSFCWYKIKGGSDVNVLEKIASLKSFSKTCQRALYFESDPTYSLLALSMKIFIVFFLFYGKYFSSVFHRLTQLHQNRKCVNECLLKPIYEMNELRLRGLFI